MDRPSIQIEPNKIAVFGEAFGLPEIPLVGSAEYKHSEAALAPHSHEGCLEFVCLYKGRQVYRMGGVEYRLYGGMVFAAPPGLPHSTGGYPEDKAAFQWLQIDLSLPGLLGLPVGEADALRARLLALPPAFPGQPALKRHLDTFLAAARSDDDLRQTRMRTELTAFLLDILACGETDAPPQGISGDIRFCLEQLEESYARSIDWSDLARSIHLSDSRFRQKFKEQLGLPPQEYLWRRRMDTARERIAEGDASFTAIAEELGFDTPSYFTRVFKRYTGLTPTQYREKTARSP